MTTLIVERNRFNAYHIETTLRTQDGKIKEIMNTERYELLKDVVLNIDEVKKELRLPKGGLYDSLLDLHKHLYDTDKETVTGIIKCMGTGTYDISFSKDIYNLAERIKN